jgi:hypothetical protein
MRRQTRSQLRTAGPNGAALLGLQRSSCGCPRAMGAAALKRAPRGAFCSASSACMIGLVVLLAGCTSAARYRPGPPTTVGEPSYSGPVAVPTRPPNGQALVPPPSAVQPPCPPIEQPNGFTSWLRSGRGWTWGAARRGPVRDEGLDRLMVDTLTNSRPVLSQEPLPPVNCTIPGDTWIYPAPAAVPPDPMYESAPTDSSYP